MLVEFYDKLFQPGASDKFKDLFFSTGTRVAGSVNDYFRTVSNQKVSFTGDVVGPFMMPQASSWYAGVSNGRSYVPGAPSSAILADHALTASQNYVNTSYDNDGNDHFDAFIVAHAGQCASSTGNPADIWSLKWNIPQPRLINGVNVYAFLTIAEDAQLGHAAHELGHLVFGWPDLYDDDYSSDGVGKWCLMGHGGALGAPGPTASIPAAPSAWCKMKQDWIDVEVIKENKVIDVEDIKSSFKAFRLWAWGNESSPEYFLIENRQKVGKTYDQEIPSSGLLGTYK